MAECKVMKCSCQHLQQDNMYGKSMRLWNPMGKGNQITGYRCTICGAKSGAGVSAALKKK